MFNVTDRAYFEWYFWSGQTPMRLDLVFNSDSVNGITVICLKDNLDNSISLRQRKRWSLAKLGTLFR